MSGVWIHSTETRVQIEMTRLFNSVLSVFTSGDLSRAELMMMTIADVIKQLVEAHEQGKDINLNKSVHFKDSFILMIILKSS